MDDNASGTGPAALASNTPVRSAAEASLKLGVGWRANERKYVESSDELLRLATQAEVFSAQVIGHFTHFLISGMVARMLNDEVAAGNTEPLVIETAAEVTRFLEDEGAALEGSLQYRVLSIRNLVGSPGLCRADHGSLCAYAANPSRAVLFVAWY